MKIINRTPHAVTLLVGDEQVVLQPVAPAVRCAVERVEVGTLDIDDGGRIAITASRFGEVHDAPPVQDDVVYVVSRIVAEAAGRPDFLVPDAVERDSSGAAIGCRSLAVIGGWQPSEKETK